MIKINLVPAEFLAKQTQQHRVLQAVVGVALLATVIVAMSLVHMARANSLESNLKEREERLRQLQEIVQQVKTLETEGATVKAHLDAINGLLKAGLVYTNFMQDLLKSLPGAIWFSSLQTTIKGTETVDFNAAAQSRSAEDLAEWINILETGGKYSNVDLGAISITAGAAGKTLSFPIRATYLVPR